MIQDSSEQIVKLCELWWETRDLHKDQSLFMPFGKYYIEKSYNAARCWRWQIEQFINCDFEYKNDDGTDVVFKPKNLDKYLLERLIGQLGIGIGLFPRDLLSIYKRVKMK